MMISIYSMLMRLIDILL